jgi:hypothetical protein
MTVQQPDIQWYIARDGKQHGPLSDVEMRTFVAQGHLRPTDLIWRPGFADWRPAPAVFPFPAPDAAPPAPAFNPPPAAKQQPAPARTATSSSFGATEQRSYEPARNHAAASAADTGGGGRGRRIGIAAGGAAVVLLLVGGGWYAMKSGALDGLSGSGDATVPTVTADATASKAPPAAPAAAAAPATPPVSEEAVNQAAQELDGKFQQLQMWNVVKREFPDWYTQQLREFAKLQAQQKPQIDIAKAVAQALVELRRKHATEALAASTDKLKDVANAFLANLKSLSERSVGACYGFISQGETAPAVLELMLSPKDGASVQAQVTAIFEAIADGRKAPHTHERAVKADYEVLVQQLTKLGWKENDLKVFSNPSALSHEPPARVCQMVQDWFVAHLAVEDKGTQERLLVETLKPVVSG